MVLVLSNHQLVAMQAHAERVYPEECCGLMLGEIQQNTSDALSDGVFKHLIELVPLTNQWLADDDVAAQTYTKRRRYSIDPKDMLRVQKQARSQGLNIIGIYHSHPDHVAEPSECDRAQAWPDYAYVIVAVQGPAPIQDQVNGDAFNTDSKETNPKAVDIKNWTLDSSHQFQPEAMNVSPGVARDRMPVPA